MTKPSTDTQARQGIFTSVADFVRTWDEECEKTEQLYNAIPADVWHKQIIPNYRTLARLAWHINLTPKEMLERTGLHIEGPAENAPLPKDPGQILKTHKQVWKSVSKEVPSKWNDAALKQHDFMYVENWTRSLTLSAVLCHMIHHRAQMTVLLRASGHQVPGMYGPALEEWAAMGLQPPTV